MSETSVEASNVLHSAAALCERAVDRTYALFPQGSADGERVRVMLRDAGSACTGAASTDFLSGWEHTRRADLLRELTKQLVVLATQTLHSRVNLDRYPVDQRWTDMEQLEARIHHIVAAQPRVR
jgi:hypothetical protein